MISFFSVKQSDNTYTIYRSHYGCNSIIQIVGIRGCNVKKLISKLICKYNPI
jgi:hypothetical protein